MKVVLLLLCASVFAYDMLCRRVPNVLLGLAIALQVSVLLVLGRGMNGLTPLQSLIGFALGFAVFFPLYLLRVMGAGDVKFFAVIGLLLGAAPLMPVWLIGSMLALGHALVMLAVRSAAFPWVSYASLQLGRTPFYPQIHQWWRRCLERVRVWRGNRTGLPYAGYLAVGMALIVLGE